MRKKAKQLLVFSVCLIALQSFASSQRGAMRTENLMASALPFLIVLASGTLTMVLFRRKE